MIRIPEVKISIDEDEDKILDYACKKIDISENVVISWSIFKKSIDARKKDKIYFVYTIDLVVEDERLILKKNRKKGVISVDQKTYDYKRLDYKGEKPIIVGMGPAGLFAGIVLSELGLNPIILERGKDVDNRARDINEFWEKGVLNPESNVQFGEGGAGTFSDGKLTTLIKDSRSRKVLEYFVNANAPEEILYVNKPHIGTDILREVVKNLRKKIISNGGAVRFGSKVTDIIIENGQVFGVRINNEEVIKSNRVILALGHSARDTFHMIHEKGLHIEQKGFSIGVRIEHPQELINKNQYGDSFKHEKLGAAEYKLSGHYENNRSAYTFCMCPGGYVVAASSEAGMVVTNGMSEHKRDHVNANSALLVSVFPKDFGSEHPLAGVEYQRNIERLAFIEGGSNYCAPAQKVGDFLNNRASKDCGKVHPTYTPGVKAGDLRKCLPEYVTDTLKAALIDFDKKIIGFAQEDALMTGVETRSSSPIRITRGEDLQSNIKGIYPAGEGAGYAGGIISAAVDGIRIAEGILKEIEGENHGR